ncbi:hypothetical protein PAECIP112173_04333 [Paenibacillus sp. JJ-100]|uniref:hypothetical protein n=1 Tax=Paenibacillus sp. JJ-100 TaxID=2974896 RepID=UPI0022FFB834|nr:hypothetical protein [Paenibacillus sp. JJ-100]CAI6084575.1 hypothetical protein PAECIP112173_04333 [Paenibacillus sp. JJ-100]
MKQRIYAYRYDAVSILFMVIVIGIFLAPIYTDGHIVFSDLAFGWSSERYLEEIVGVWNERWSTSTLFNAPRLLYILPFYILSTWFDHSGAVLIKSFITSLLLVSGLSMYLFTKRLVSVYYSKNFTFQRIMALTTGSLFYAINPWVIFRIQHIYLLCGYSLFPLVLMFFFNAFDPKFQTQRIPNYQISKVYRKNVIDLFLLALVFTVSAAAIHYFFFGAMYLAMFAFLLLIKVTWEYRREGWNVLRGIYRSWILKGLVFGLFFGMLSFYWLSLYGGSILMGAQASQHNINVVDTLSLFSQNSTLLNVLLMVSYWWPMFPLSQLPLSFYIFGGIILIIMLIGIVMRSKGRTLILIFGGIALILILASTGTTISWLANFFVIVVTKTPIIGAMFRDPNKIVGLLALNFAILLTFGVIQIQEWIRAKKFGRPLKFAVVIAVTACLWIYISPVRHEFIEGYYKPVQVPKEYREINNELSKVNNYASKALYIPVADQMIQNYNGVATPVWNVGDTAMEKATGDVHVYSSSQNTLFHHEGNAPSISYYMNFLQYLLDQGLSSKLGTLYVPFGISQLVYHNEYSGQRERQQFNEQILDFQEGLKRTYKNSIFSMYHLADPLPYMSIVSNKIITPYGYSRAESYSHQPGFDFNRFGLLYSALDPSVKTVQTANKGDYIESSSMKDLWLSQLPDSFYLRPFDVIEDGNAFLKWSKSYVSNADWMWFLSSQGIRNFPFDMEMGTGVAVTFASNKLDVLPYQMNQIEGKVVADFDSLLKMEKFFQADNPGMFDVQAHPAAASNNIPLLQGEIIKGDPDNIWQVAKSGLLDAKENNPYRFSIVASGRGTNKMHVKVRFYDEKMQELGISYVVAPTEEYNFDKVNFFGEYVSPPGSAHMRIDLLSQQRPEQKTYWWIHDIFLQDLEAYKKPNTFTMVKKMDKDTLAHVYIRVLKSQAGGEIEIEMPDKTTTSVQTRSQLINQFEWVDLGPHIFPAGASSVTVTNKDGFNAINMFAVIPENLVDTSMFPIKQAIKRAKTFMILEAENDFEGKPEIQSTRTYPELSMGRGLRYLDGELSKKIEIVKSGQYDLSLLADIPKSTDGEITVRLEHLQTGQVIERKLHSKDIPVEEKISSEQKVIITDPYREGFNKRITSSDTVLQGYGRAKVNSIALESGEYNLSVALHSQVASMVEVHDFHPMRGDEYNLEQGTEEQQVSVEQPSSTCAFSGLSLGETTSVVSQGGLDIKYGKTYSCEWYTYTSNPIPVTGEEEYVISFLAKSDDIHDRHIKVAFMDRSRNLIQTTYVDEVEEKDKFKWNKYEQLITAPQQATSMQIQILARGDGAKDGWFRMKDLNVIPYNQLVLLDQVMLAEHTDTFDFFYASATEAKLNYQRTGSMSREFSLVNPQRERLLINEIESPNPLWEFTLDTDKIRARLAVNGVTSGFITTGSGEGQIVVILEKMYRVGIALLLLGTLVGVLCILPWRWRKKKSYKTYL